jgi:hypothetical protein
MGSIKKEKNEKIVNNKDDNIEEEIDKLMGIEQNNNKYTKIKKNEWRECMYCEKFHHNDYYVSGMEYCIHCWAWLNGHEYDIESGVYGGIHSQNDINKLIKKVYPVHCVSKCVNEECLFNKIVKYSEIKLLNNSLVELLELNKKTELKAVSFNYKNKNLNVNFDESYIVL